jgi:hypothetical protein
MQFLQQFATAIPDSYMAQSLAHSVESWFLLIAAGVLLLEWLLSRR